MRKHKSSLLIIIVLFGLVPGFLTAQWFGKEEYAARRSRLMENIPDGIAILMGAQLAGGYMEYYQNNDFMYFSGVEIPNAILIIDGIHRETSLFFSASLRDARNEGVPAAFIEDPKGFTGIEKIYPYESFSSRLSRLAESGAVFYTPFKPEELMRECTLEKYRILQRTRTFNIWDGRLTRELQFVRQLKERFPHVEIKDCSRTIWDLRIYKKPAEIELLREAGRIAVKAHIELMRSTRVGMYEYELAALYEYYCKKAGAQNLAYYMIISSAENHPYAHYYKHDRKLEDGDFLVIDVGPDLGYYDIDITIAYPVNGKFSPRQREIYEACNAMHEACMQVYRPGLTVPVLEKEVHSILERQGFDMDDPLFKIRGMRARFGHYVGMAVHDVGGSPQVLEPGMVFANEPMAIFPEEDLGVRVEDTILVTEDGIENLSSGIPRTVKEIENLMKEDGAVQILKKAELY